MKISLRFNKINSTKLPGTFKLSLDIVRKPYLNSKPDLDNKVSGLFLLLVDFSILVVVSLTFTQYKHKIGVINAYINILNCQIVGGRGQIPILGKIFKCTHVIKTPSFCDILNFFLAFLLILLLLSFYRNRS